jgi:hypothetical protein
MGLMGNSRTVSEVAFRLKISRTSNAPSVIGEAEAVALRTGSKEVAVGEVDSVVAALEAVDLVVADDSGSDHGLDDAGAGM